MLSFVCVRIEQLKEGNMAQVKRFEVKVRVNGHVVIEKIELERANWALAQKLAEQRYGRHNVINVRQIA